MAHLLLIAAYAPPSRNVGARRTENLVRQLAARGHRLTLVTSAASGAGQVDGASRTIRTRDLAITRLNWRRRQVAALTSGSGDEYDPVPSAISRLVVPDLELLSWAPFALGAALGVLRDRDVDAVVTTSPPLSVHLVGRVLRSRGLPWIADFRDGWGFEDLRAPFASRLLTAIDRRFERGIYRRASRIVTTSEAISAWIRGQTPVGVATVSNGFDPALLAGASAAAGPAGEGPHRFVHTGRVGPRIGTLAAVLAAAESLPGPAEAAAPSAEVVLAGPRTREEGALLARHPRTSRYLGDLDRDAAVELQRGAGTLLLLTDEGRRGTVPAKLFEYMAARRPILVVGPRSAAAGIVEETATGRHVVADPERIAEAMQSMARARYEPDDEAIGRYDWQKLAANYETQVLAAIAAVPSPRAPG